MSASSLQNRAASLPRLLICEVHPSQEYNTQERAPPLKLSERTSEPSWCMCCRAEMYPYETIAMVGDGITDLEAVQITGGADVFIG